MTADGKPETIGLIGLGLVGTAIAEHLLEAGYGVIGFDIDPARGKALAKLGGRAVSGPLEVADGADRVILSLLTTEVVCQVVEGDGGLLQAAGPPHTIIDTTTGTPDETMALAGRLEARGIAFLDATISGSSQQIRDRQALFMVGGAAAAYAACEDLLRVITDKAMHVGPSGSGSKAKLASNLILGLNRLVLAEGLVFADRLGLDLEAFLDLLRQSPAYSRAVDVKGDKMVKGDFTPQARVSQHDKDLEIILACAEAVGQELPLAQLHHQILQDLMAGGDGDLDCSAVIEAIRRKQTGSGK
ncbi:MAG: NAD(P)-dependent oxidoreductase [Rhodospirillales bacterium]|nr:NAD(P)-dependent oxidoreductase [Rhodospirillales bacterium]